MEPAGALSKITWFSISQRLVLTYGNEVAGKQALTLVVPAAFGLQIPADGLLANNAGIAIESSAASGPVLKTALTDYLPIGAFVNTSLEYSNPRIGQASKITLRLSLIHI